MPRRIITPPYIPRADGALRDWMNNFTAVVAIDPAAAGLSSAAAHRLSELARRYETAYLRSRLLRTRGPASVADKNAVRREVWAVVRPIAMAIKHDPGIDDLLRAELGVYSPNPEPVRIGRPRSRPNLQVTELSPGLHRLRYDDPKFPSRTAKPPGVTHLQLAIAVGKNPPRNARSIRRLEVVTRHVFDVKFATADRGKTATYFGRWVTRRGLTGPWSGRVTMTVV
ncbi:hypothetical protein BH10PLA1_BH10PLA1_15050 [soil metagenome]